MIIDFHTHFDSGWYAADLRDIERTFIAGLDRCGVSKACIFTMQGFFGDCPRHNDRLARHVETHPDRLIAFATIDPKLGKAAVDELRRCLKNPAFRGVKLHPWLQAFAPVLAKPVMIDLLHCAAEHRAPVLFHDGTPPYSTTFQIADVARWVPQATIVLGHAGICEYNLAAARLTRDIPNLYACICGPKSADIAHLVETAGADKVLFGSDYGFADWRTIAERLDELIHAGLTPAQLSAIRGENAARLLRIEC